MLDTHSDCRKNVNDGIVSAGPGKGRRVGIDVFCGRPGYSAQGLGPAPHAAAQKEHEAAAGHEGQGFAKRGAS